MHLRENVNFVKRETFNNIRACARQYTAFHAKSNGKPLCFYAMPLAKAAFSATQIQLRK
jgi:hypothetical protein